MKTSNRPIAAVYDRNYLLINLTRRFRFCYCFLEQSHIFVITKCHFRVKRRNLLVAYSVYLISLELVIS